MNRVEKIREAVRIAIKRSGMNQTEIGEMMGFSQAGLSHKINRDSVADLVFLENLSHALGIDKNILLNADWVEEEKEPERYYIKAKKQNFTKTTIGNSYNQNTPLPQDSNDYRFLQKQLSELTKDNREYMREILDLSKQIRTLEKENWELKKNSTTGITRTQVHENNQLRLALLK